MDTEHAILSMRARVCDYAADGKTVALVPTMGALHEGHLSLVDIAADAADVVVVSVFVNPLQFGPDEDFGRYPRTLETDAALLSSRGATVLFAPSVEEMFPSSSQTTVSPPDFATAFEGAIRPGHFAGVLTVVAKLLNIVQPRVAVFGRKDLQQLSMIRAMVLDLNFPVEIVAGETIRGADGLALSSRNRYLDELSRPRACRLRAALLAARGKFASGVTAADAIVATGRAELDVDPSMSIDYFDVVSERDFSAPNLARTGDSIVSAVRIDGTRLIDNILL
ncbi:MAG: pantoate--beta-alanine ligase [Gemmatimonadaceae bacterium]